MYVLVSDEVVALVAPALFYEQGESICPWKFKGEYALADELTSVPLDGHWLVVFALVVELD